MINQRDAYKIIIPDLREHAFNIFGIDKDLNLKDTISEFLNSFLKTLYSNQSQIGQCYLENPEEDVPLTSGEYIKNIKMTEACIACIPSKSDIKLCIDSLEKDSKCMYHASVLKICLDMHEAYQQHSFSNKMSGTGKNARVDMRHDVLDILKLQVRLIRKVAELELEQTSEYVHSVIDMRLYSKLDLQPNCK